MQAKKKIIITVPPDGRKKLMELYGITRQTLYNALSFRTEGERPEKIRQDALNLFGGIENEKIVFY